MKTRIYKVGYGVDGDTTSFQYSFLTHGIMKPDSGVFLKMWVYGQSEQSRLENPLVKRTTATFKLENGLAVISVETDKRRWNRFDRRFFRALRKRGAEKVIDFAA